MSAEWVRCRRLRGIFVKKIFKKGISLLCAAALVLGCAACSGGSPKQTAVTDITVWTYYNGDQMESFTKLVDEKKAFRCPPRVWAVSTIWKPV